MCFVVCYSGFRYVSVYGLYTINQIKDVTCTFIHSEFTLIGNFTTTDPTINQIQHNLQWSILSNMISVPSDCPSRDERRGYGGDASLSIDAALFNFDMVRYYDSWLYQWAVSQDETGTLPIVAPGGSGPPDPNWYVPILHPLPLHSRYQPVRRCVCTHLILPNGLVLLLQGHHSCHSHLDAIRPLR